MNEREQGQIEFDITTDAENGTLECNDNDSHIHISVSYSDSYNMLL